MSNNLIEVEVRYYEGKVLKKHEGLECRDMTRERFHAFLRASPHLFSPDGDPWPFDRPGAAEAAEVSVSAIRAAIEEHREAAERTFERAFGLLPVKDIMTSDEHRPALSAVAETPLKDGTPAIQAPPHIASNLTKVK